MILNDAEFNLLVDLEANINRNEDNDTESLIEKGLIDAEFSVSEKGYKHLKPFQVKKAIIVAAGFGSRMEPATLDRPKTMVKVKGKRIIDRLLDALLDLDITNITIVRGYKKDFMDRLLEKYPMIKFIDNDAYAHTNNISSMHLVKDELQGVYILESDLVLYNPKIIKKYARDSHYFGIFKKQTDDWVINTKNSYISEMTQKGGNTHQMAGISYWSPRDGKQLAIDIEEFYQDKANKDKFWDQVPLEAYKDNYKVKILEVNEDDIIKIDTYEELKILDKSYL